MLSASFIVACSLLMQSPAAPEAAPVPTEPVPPPVMEPVEAPVVELVHPGQAPLHELRYQPRIDVKQTVSMTTISRSQLVVGGQRSPESSTPTQRVMFELSMEKPGSSPEAAEGRILAAARVTKVEVIDEHRSMPGTVAMLREQLRPLERAEGRLVFSNDGLLQASGFSLPQETTSQVQANFAEFQYWLNQFAVPLPREAVGVGASWRVKTRPVVSGVQLEQTVTYELLSLDADAVRLKAKVEQSAGPQLVKLVGAPDDVICELISQSATGEAEIDLNLARLAASLSVTSLRSETTSRITSGGVDHEVTSHNQIELRIRSVDADPPPAIAPEPAAPQPTN